MSEGSRKRAAPAAGKENHATGTAAEGASPTKRARAASVFLATLDASGVVRAPASALHAFAVSDGVALRQFLTRKLRHRPAECEAFVESLDEYVGSAERLKQCLRADESGAAGGEGARGQATSLMRLLLGVAPVQPLLVDVLIGKLCEHASEGEDMPFRENIPRLILTQFRWMDNVVSSRRLTNKLLECLGLGIPTLTRDVIAFLPEVIVDADHSLVVRTLQGLMQEDASFTVPILDALSNLNLHDGLLSEVTASVTHRLGSTTLESLPVVIRFLLQTATPDSVAAIVHALREDLDVITLQSSTAAAAAAAEKESRGKGKRAVGRPAAAAADSLEALVLHALQSGICFHKHVASAFMREIGQLHTANDLRPLDLWVLIIIMHMPNQRKAGSSLLAKKVAAGALTVPLMHAALRQHEHVLAPFFSTLLSMCAMLVRAPGASVCAFGGECYATLFAALHSEYHRQELLSSVFTHVSAGAPREVDMALHVLLQLAHTHTAALQPFTAYMKGILDYLSVFSVPQLRSMFHLFAVLGCTPRHADPDTAGGAGVDAGGTVRLDSNDDVHIVVRKHLSNTTLSYRRIGIIGCVALFARFGMQMRVARDGSIVMDAQRAKHGKHTAHASEDTHSNATSGGSSGEGASADGVRVVPIANARFKQAKALLAMALDKCAADPFAMCFLYDELALCVQLFRLDERVVEWLGRRVSARFENEFMEDYVKQPPASLQGGEVPHDEQWLNLDGAEQTNSLRVAPLAVGSPTGGVGDVTSQRLVYMCAMFRLVQVCTVQAGGGSVDAIEGMLGCPLRMFPRDMIDVVGSLHVDTQTHMCLSLFYAINWVRECVNAFSRPDLRGESGEEELAIQARVCLRLGHLVELERDLSRCLAASAHVALPITSSRHITTDALTAMPKRPKSRKGAQGADPALSVLTTVSTVAGGGAGAAGDAVGVYGDATLESVSHCMRELELHVSSVLAYEAVQVTKYDSALDASVPFEVAELSRATALYLLYHLHTCMSAVLSNPKKAPPGGARAASGPAKVPPLVALTHTPVALVHELVPVLRAVVRHIKTSADKLRGAGGVDGSGASDDDDADVDILGNSSPDGDSASSLAARVDVARRCLRQGLACVKCLFACNALYTAENRDVLQEAYHIFHEDPAHVAPLSPGRGLETAFTSVEALAAHVDTFEGAVDLVDVVLTLIHHHTQGADTPADASAVTASTTTDDVPDVRGRVSQMAGVFLRRGWPCAKFKAARLAHLLHVYISYSASPISTIDKLVLKVISSWCEHVHEPLASHPVMRKATFPVFYKVALEELRIAFAGIDTSASVRAEEDVKRVVFQVRQCVIMFTALCTLIKTFELRPLIAAALKNGRLFVDSYVRKLEWFSKRFRLCKHDVLVIGRELQKGTRQIQAVCAHSKLSKDMVLVALVPPMRRSLEALIYKTKSLLESNHCLDAFWLGNLKHKNLRGEEVVVEEAEDGAGESESESESDDGGEGDEGPGSGAVSEASDSE